MSIAKLIVGISFVSLLGTPAYAQGPNIPDFRLEDAVSKIEIYFDYKVGDGPYVSIDIIPIEPKPGEEYKYEKNEFYFFDRNKDNRIDLVFTKRTMPEMMYKGEKVLNHVQNELTFDEDFDGKFDWYLIDIFDKNNKPNADGEYEWILKFK